jgi:predicted Rossmann fold nucleotide-binding protein DprA/Smf involved in DNA uptake
LVECVEDVLEELLPQLGEAGRPQVADDTPEADRSGISDEAIEKESVDIKSILLQLKNADRLHVDALIESCGMNAQTVLKLMLELELRGIVVQHPGKRFSLA